MSKRNPHLTAKQVRAIRKSHAAGKTIAQLAKKYGRHPSVVYRAAKGVTFKTVSN